MIGLESCIGAVCKVLVVNERAIALEDLIRLLTVKPRNIMGFEADLFQVGIPAEIAILDPTKDWVFDSTYVQSRSVNSPYYGETLTGRVEMTIYRGYIGSN